jgi:hypothetical protein
MSKIQIKDLDDLNVEEFAILNEYEAAGIQGGLSTQDALAASLASLVSSVNAALQSLGGRKTK